MNTLTERDALIHHLPMLSNCHDDSLTDAARAMGIMSVCLGCGTVTGTDLKDEVPVPDPFLTYEAYRKAYREFLMADDPDYFECCPDATTIIY